VIPYGPEDGTEYSVIAPLVDIRPILLCTYSVNYNAPSGPDTIEVGYEDAVVVGNSETLGSADADFDNSTTWRSARIITSANAPKNILTLALLKTLRLL
jgi:hypothetical protein